MNPEQLQENSMRANATLTVYFDGGCPVCAREIAFYRRPAGATAGRDLFAVGEYWTPDAGTLGWFIEQTGRRLSVFDFRLHFNLRDASRGGGSFDMTRIFDGTQVQQDPALAVTFVDNHDSYREDAVEICTDIRRAKWSGVELRPSFNAE